MAHVKRQTKACQQDYELLPIGSQIGWLWLLTRNGNCPILGMTSYTDTNPTGRMTMNNKDTVMPTVQDLEGARELGRLSGEVRVLKWGSAIVITMVFTTMFAYLTYLAQQISEVRTEQVQQFSAVQQQINELREGQAAIRERLSAIEERLERPGSGEQYGAPGEGQAAHSAIRVPGNRSRGLWALQTDQFTQFRPQQA